MSFLAFYNAMINNLATGTPPAIPAATSDQNSSTNNSDGTATPNRKSDKEKERRERTNELFEELYNLIKKDGDGKMSQANILKCALKASINHKREYHSDQRSRGLHAGLEKVKELTIQHLESLNLPYPANITSLQKLEKLFEDFWDVVLPVFTPGPANPSAPSTSDASTSDETRKEKKKNREQGRRDNLDDRFALLRQFIDENKLVKAGDQKIQVLETIIRYLKYKPTQTAADEIGFIQGRHLAQNVAVSFFKREAHLSAHVDALQEFFISQLGPLDSSTHMDNFQFDQTAILHFMSIHPAIFDVDDIITPAPIANPTPVTQAFSFWRPWEQPLSTVHP